MPAQRKSRLSRSDKAILHAMEPVVDAIATAFGSDCEVVLHSVEDPGHSIVKIVNPELSGRQVGSPSTDISLKILAGSDSFEEGKVRSYITQVRGQEVKSTGVDIRNAEDRLIGMLCINLNISAPAIRFLRGIMIAPEPSKPDIEEDFANGVDDLVHRAIDKAKADAATASSSTLAEYRKGIVQDLWEKGIFEVSGAVDRVASELDISRYTVYNYLRQVRFPSRNRPANSATKDGKW